MPVRMLNFLREPPPRIQIRSAIVDTEEWKDFLLTMGAGLKPQEYVTVTFPQEHPIWKVCKNPYASFIHQAKKKVKELHLPYDVYECSKIIYVVGRGSNIS